MQLFYVCANTNENCDEGDDLGHLISAPSAEEAARMWCERRDRADPMVFRVPAVSPKPMIHDWHSPWETRGAPNVYVGYPE